MITCSSKTLHLKFSDPFDNTTSMSASCRYFLFLLVSANLPLGKGKIQSKVHYFFSAPTEQLPSLVIGSQPILAGPSHSGLIFLALIQRFIFCLFVWHMRLGQFGLGYLPWTPTFCSTRPDETNQFGPCQWALAIGPTLVCTSLRLTRRFAQSPTSVFYLFLFLRSTNWLWSTRLSNLRRPM